MISPAIKKSLLLDQSGTGSVGYVALALTVALVAFSGLNALGEAGELAIVGRTEGQTPSAIGSGFHAAQGDSETNEIDIGDGVSTSETPEGGTTEHDENGGVQPAPPGGLVGAQANGASANLDDVRFGLAGGFGGGLLSSLGNGMNRLVDASDRAEASLRENARSLVGGGYQLVRGVAFSKGLDGMTLLATGAAIPLAYGLETGFQAGKTVFDFIALDLTQIDKGLGAEMDAHHYAPIWDFPVSGALLEHFKESLARLRGGSVAEKLVESAYRKAREIGMQEIEWPYEMKLGDALVDGDDVLREIGMNPATAERWIQMEFRFSSTDGNHDGRVKLFLVGTDVDGYYPATVSTYLDDSNERHSIYETDLSDRTTAPVEEAIAAAERAGLAPDTLELVGVQADTYERADGVFRIAESSMDEHGYTTTDVEIREYRNRIGDVVPATTSTWVFAPRKGADAQTPEDFDDVVLVEATAQEGFQPPPEGVESLD